MNRHPSIASLSDAKLARALLDHCRWQGLSWGEEAALQLLVAQGTWLRRGEFRAHITAEVRAAATNRTGDADRESERPSEARQIESEPMRQRDGKPQLVLEAWVDWQGVAGDVDRSPASTGETALLRLACHLTGHLPPTRGRRVEVDWTLAEILVPFDATTALLATRAVAIAAIGPDAVGPLQ